MRIQALSVVSPAGVWIAQGLKTCEVRSWSPDVFPIERLLIVENDRRLSCPGEIDPDGRAVAVVRISDVHPWRPDEAEAACSTYEPGWLAWTIENVQPIEKPFRVVAARRIYEVEIPDELMMSTVSGDNLLTQVQIRPCDYGGP